ncbi:cytochrome c oxidase assembly protein COX16-domain-containing protein [Blakeslea trispora]|nr:cytochrome c oxidase assembly protein COX16-domain-containing protein [Blakeslea trispora]
MVKFDKKPYGHNSTFDPLINKAKQRPFLFFGLPFITVMVVGSFGLAQLTQTKYDHRDRRHTAVAKEEALGMDKSRRKLSLQEEYFRLQAKTEDEWDQVRIHRPQQKKP